MGQKKGPAPLYGWIQDRHGPMYTIMVSSGCCALGCGLRGFAQDFYWLVPAFALAGFGGGNLITTISTHVATETPPARRALVLSALAVQGSVLRICGQGLYVPWDAALRGAGLSEKAAALCLVVGETDQLVADDAVRDSEGTLDGIHGAGLREELDHRVVPVVLVVDLGLGFDEVDAQH